VRGIADTLDRIFDDADVRGANPLAAAMVLCRRCLIPTGKKRAGACASPVTK